MCKNNIIKRALFFILLSIIMINAHAQTGLNFQGVARTSNNVILASQAITIKLSILQGSATGTADYVETRRVTTNAQGLFTAVIGDTGAISTLGNFTNINWKLSPKFLKIEMDPAAGANFITMGTTQFQYVAYAQFAKSVDAENIVGIVPVSLGGTGVSTIAGLKTALTLNNVNNTTDLTKPISTLTQTALDLKLNVADTSKYTKQTYSDSALLTKLKISDTAAMLSSRIARDTLNLSNRINLKANTTDVTSGLDLKLNVADTSKYTKQTYSDSALLTKFKISDTAAMLSSRIARDTLNLSNRINLKSNTTDVTTSLSLKESTSNKSTAVDLGGTSPSDILFPTQKAVKDYVAANNSGGGVSDGGITTIKIADAAVTDAKINTVSGSKVIGNITGNAATATTAGNIIATTNTTLTSLSSLTSVGTLANLTVTNPIIGSITGNAATATTATTAGTASTATKLATSRNINGVGFDGSGDITVTADAGTLTGTTLNATITGSSLTSVGTLANLTVTNAIAGSITGNASTATTAGTASTATKLATVRNINGVGFDGSGDITVTADAGTLTGTTLKSTITGSSLTSVGTLANLTVTNAIAGSITGNAATATTAGNITATANTTLTSLSSLATVGTITSGVWSGTAVAVEKGGTGLTAAGTNGQVLTSTGSGTLTWTNVSADAGTLTGTTLKSTVTGSSLTSVGILSNATVNGKVIVGASSAATASAVLEASSTTQGFLPPRMTATQRDAISSPAAGLTIWNATDVELQVYNGSLWVNMNGITNQTLTIGQTYQGGKVAYVLQSGDPGYDANTPHGLIAATSDQSTGIRWYNGSYTTTGATGTAIGTGLSNTNTIITSQGATATSYAAGLARAYKGGGYTDWYLPSKDELAKLYAMKVLGFGGFAANDYWSSTESASASAWVQYFFDGSQPGASKNYTAYVRAIRAF